jgi:hypothetical protein
LKSGPFEVTSAFASRRRIFDLGFFALKYAATWQTRS